MRLDFWLHVRRWQVLLFGEDSRAAKRHVPHREEINCDGRVTQVLSVQLSAQATRSDVHETTFVVADLEVPPPSEECCVAIWESHNKKFLSVICIFL
jgi:hypothetical protein